MGKVQASSQSPTGQAPQGVIDEILLLVSRQPARLIAQLDRPDILRLGKVCAWTGEQ